MTGERSGGAADKLSASSEKITAGAELFNRNAHEARTPYSSLQRLEGVARRILRTRLLW